MTLLGRPSSDQAEQLRQTRNDLRQKVRNDWTYPNAPHVVPDHYAAPSAAATPSTLHMSTSTQDARDHVNSHIAANITAYDPPLDNHTSDDWVERYYSDGEDSASDKDDKTPRFETPDSVGTSLEERKRRRRARRQQRYEAEMAENIGLAHWSAQRNLWTGARPRTAENQTSSTALGAIPDANLLIPKALPLLPADNAVRSRITTNTYSDIYTKIILQGRTPSIPINLSDITRSLVHGWKEEGNWPPKPTPAEASLVKKHPHIKGSLKKMGKIFGLGGPGVPVEKGPV
ncbi:hypothetical protein AUEXF2481DRAFT_3884 [Aureobasidium subglaciale EXF-2481]|uniref:Gag1-like clamp domain-containing protein n=1 Tax=Aureobasidium subglaciale (strain EXF-2481) TaxID=1043005 RepID=A0A074YQJ7_AURSE|nr:uncharacterized protein AUEXF2481DRAFT_3884 [Aureobasidium subglaciale EXF-2481]KAI5201214.1 hypothetical protein E4T38_06182 [Aureobasidium subglaciale]KAI5219827.1 hypothetical protein E4T40_06203 [Aureobasidium subglaciale]KAI5223663.1 hypothetical protein E4T41_05994 [Aureobasidium subglaciale]KAI5260524.1 hypothetical protein E4T46_05937 [Aureobasidium subglaciale]KEQ96372.1 hypothetical protein AUEXF2481DRAFT_3884 [Aureobasidium subglaciale EXF-2481]